MGRSFVCALLSNDFLSTSRIGLVPRGHPFLNMGMIAVSFSEPMTHVMCFGYFTQAILALGCIVLLNHLLQNSSQRGLHPLQTPKSENPHLHIHQSINNRPTQTLHLHLSTPTQSLPSPSQPLTQHQIKPLSHLTAYRK